MMGEIVQSFARGNTYMYLMVFIAFAASVIILERMLMLQFVFNINFSKFLTSIRKMLVANDLERALSYAKSVSGSSLPFIARRAIEAADSDPTTIRGTIEEETIGFLPRIEVRIGFLIALSTLVMFLGILGTIEALWRTFHAIDVLDSAKKQVVLSHEIAGALNPVAFGLMISMMILVFHQIIRGMALRLVDRIHHGVTVLTNLMVPQDSAAFISTIAAAAAAPAEAAAAPEESAAPAQGKSDAQFDDAPVQDIRDEEEII